MASGKGHFAQLLQDVFSLKKASPTIPTGSSPFDLSCTTTNMIASNLRFTSADSTDTFVSGLKKYIETGYEEDSRLYQDDLRNFSILRNDVAVANVDATEGNIKKLWKYYQQLVFISSKFPSDENTLRVPLIWTTSYPLEPRNVQGFGINYELCCILWNIAALYSQLGVLHEDRTSSDGLKRAAMWFQLAAGVYKHLLDNLYPGELEKRDGKEEIHQKDGELKCTLPPDFGLQSLLALMDLNLGQAQECFWAKGVTDKMKDATVARLAQGVYNLYSSSLKHAQVANVFPPAFLSTLQVKQQHFAAAAQFRKACDCDEGGRYGEEIARLKFAEACIKKAQDKDLQKTASPVVLGDLRALQQFVQQRLQKAEKDNNLIYIQTIPSQDALEPIAAAIMAKPQPVPPETIDNQKLAEGSGPPLFARLVPFAVHQSLSKYSQKKQDLVQEQTMRLREATEDAHRILGEMGLPASIEALEQPMGLPNDLLRRSEEVRADGGVSGLESAWNSVRSLAQRDMDLLNAAIKSLDEERELDEEMRRQFGSRWTRPKSDDLARNLRDTSRVYKDKLDAARSSDDLVRQKLDRNMAALMALGGRREELQATIPTASNNSTPMQADQNAKLLKSQLDQLQQILRARSGLLDQFREASKNDDIAPKLLQAAAQGKDVGVDAKDSETLFAEELKKYDGVKQKVQGSLDAQRGLLDQIRDTNRKFLASRTSNPLVRERERALANLDNAYKNYKEINANLSEGLKFYSDFGAVLQRFSDSVGDFVFSRKVDMRELIGVITNGMSRGYEEPQGPGGFPHVVPMDIDPPTSPYRDPEAEFMEILSRFLPGISVVRRR